MPSSVAAVCHRLLFNENGGHSPPLQKSPKQERVSLEPIRLKRFNVKRPGLQIVVLPLGQTCSRKSAVPYRWQGGGIPNGSQSSKLMRIPNLSDGTDFRFPPGRGVIDRNQDCSSRTSLVWQESPSICCDGSRCFFIKLKGTESGVAVCALYYIPQTVAPEPGLGTNLI